MRILRSRMSRFRNDSGWNARTDFRFTAQARRVNALLARLGVETCSLIAHDTGATVARLVALADPGRVASQILINTEIPGHRPPWIPFYCVMARLPGASLSFRPLLGMSWYLRSSMGFGAFYSDRRLFDDPGRLGPYVDPLLRSSWMGPIIDQGVAPVSHRDSSSWPPPE